MTGMVDMLEDLKLECLNVVVAISQLLQTLQLSLSTSEKDGNISFNVNQRLSEAGFLYYFAHFCASSNRMNICTRKQSILCT